MTQQLRVKYTAHVGTSAQASPGGVLSLFGRYWHDEVKGRGPPWPCTGGGGDEVAGGGDEVAAMPYKAFVSRNLALAGTQILPFPQTLNPIDLLCLQLTICRDGIYIL